MNDESMNQAQLRESLATYRGFAAGILAGAILAICLISMFAH